MKHFRTQDGTRLAYELFGVRGGPLAVLCDGICCDGFAWRYLRDELAQRFRVLHVHHRGHGRSGLPRDPRAVTLAHLCEDHRELMAHLGLTSGLWLGHSMGVQLVLEMAFRHPRLVRAGVLICGAYQRPLETFKNTDWGMKLFPRVREFAADKREQIARTLRLVLPTRLAFTVAGFSEINRHLVREEDFMPYLEHFAKMPLDLFFSMLDDLAQRSSADFLARVAQPMLVLAGENDGFTPSYVSARMTDLLPKAEFELLLGGTHTAPIELPEVIGARLRRFIDDHGLAEPAPTPGRPDSLLVRWREARDADQAAA